MNIEAINERLLRAIGAGVAILSPGAWEIQFQNQAFGEWFDVAEVGAPITSVFPDLDFEALVAAIESDSRYSVEASFRRKRRTLIVALTFTRASADFVLLECQNITRIRELETMIESYSSMVERNTREIEREKERVEKLLLNIMPRNVYEEYKTFGVVTPQKYDDVTVLALDFVDFDEMAEKVGPSVMVSEMNDIYVAFDRIGEQFGSERIKTVGDAYICICGLREPEGDHAAALANAALRFVRFLERRNKTHPHQWRCRIGIASGSVIGSVVGVQKYVYDVFGVAVKLSHRLRDHAGPMQIVCAEDIPGDFKVDEIGVRAVHGFGDLTLREVRGAIAS